jgi:WD40 repeat protein
VSGSFDGIIRLWDIAKASIISYVKISDNITSMKFSPDGKKLLAGSFKGRCYVYSLEKSG